MTVWQLNLRHLRAAASIERLGSISAAAQAVSISQPAITQGLAKLEAQLGTQLFERHHDGMVATQAAMALVPRIETALAYVASTRVTMAQLRAAVALADNGSYAAASAATGLAQPSLHRAMGGLSVALKRVLVERRGKGIALTERGKRTVRAFRLACAELEAGLSELAALQGRESGRIAIGAMPLSRARLLPAAVARFYVSHPHVRVGIAEGSFTELIEPLRDGVLDLMVGALREPSPGPDVVQLPLFEDRPVVIGRKGHPLVIASHRDPKGKSLKGARMARNELQQPHSVTSPRGAVPNIVALSQYPWIVAAAGTPLRNQWEKMFSEAGLVAPPVPVECGSVITIRQLLLAGDFLTLLSPDQVAVELESGWLAKIADTPEWLTRTIGVTTRAGWRPTPFQAAFLATLVEAAEK